MPDPEPTTPASTEPVDTLHASCVVVGEAGILIRGPSGVGKSTLARDLVTAKLRDGGFARLVSDDRTRVEARHGRLIARTIASIAGLIEIRGLDIVQAPYENSAVVRLVVELSSAVPSRLPAEHDEAPFCGIMVPRLFLRAEAASAAIAMAWLRRNPSTPVTHS